VVRRSDDGRADRVPRPVPGSLQVRLSGPVPDTVQGRMSDPVQSHLSSLVPDTVQGNMSDPVQSHLSGPVPGPLRRTTGPLSHAVSGTLWRPAGDETAVPGALRQPPGVSVRVSGPLLAATRPVLPEETGVCMRPMPEEDDNHPMLSHGLSTTTAVSPSVLFHRDTRAVPATTIRDGVLRDRRKQDGLARAQEELRNVLGATADSQRSRGVRLPGDGCRERHARSRHGLDQ